MLKRDKNEILELYKVMAESIINNENKRLQTNMFYTTLIVALFSIGTKLDISMFYISLINLFLSLIWLMNINIYIRLSESKFDVIAELEKNLIYPVFKMEYDYYKTKVKRLNLTKIERLTCFLSIIASSIFIIRFLLKYFCIYL